MIQKDIKESRIFALPIFVSYVEVISKMANDAKVKFVIKQEGCPLGMKGVYFEFDDLDEKSRFVTEVKRVTHPVTIWAS